MVSTHECAAVVVVHAAPLTLAATCTSALTPLCRTVQDTDGAAQQDSSPRARVSFVQGHSLTERSAGRIWRRSSGTASPLLRLASPLQQAPLRCSDPALPQQQQLPVPTLELIAVAAESAPLLARHLPVAKGDSPLPGL
jgi:hypothetical protein